MAVVHPVYKRYLHGSRFPCNVFCVCGHFISFSEANLIAFDLMLRYVYQCLMWKLYMVFFKCKHLKIVTELRVVQRKLHTIVVQVELVFNTRFTNFVGS